MKISCILNFICIYYINLYSTIRWSTYNIINKPTSYTITYLCFKMSLFDKNGFCLKLLHARKNTRNSINSKSFTIN